MSKTYASHLGHFSEDGQSYTITAARTPHGWNQYLFNDEFLASVDVRAAGMSFYKRPDGTRTNLILDSSMPRRVYLCDQQSARVFCLPGAPGGSLTITPGAAEFRAAADQLEISWQLSTPTGLRGEAWRITVRNVSPTPRRILLAGMFPLCPHGYGTAFGYDRSMILSFEPSLSAMVLTNNDPDRPDPLFNAYMMQDAPIHSFDTSGATFLGDGGIDNPAGMVAGALANRLNISMWHHAQKIAALASEHTLAPGQQVTVQMLVGVAADAAEVATIRARWLTDPQTLQAAVQSRQQDYRELTQRVQVTTPDPEFDRLNNKKCDDCCTKVMARPSRNQNQPRRREEREGDAKKRGTPRYSSRCLFAHFAPSRFHFLV